MNENLSERSRDVRRYRHGLGDRAEVLIAPSSLNLDIRRYFEDSQKIRGNEGWTIRPQLPTSTEVMDQEVSNGDVTGAVPLLANLKKGAWPDKTTFLGAHYELLREDAVAGLRQALASVRIIPEAREDAFNGSFGIYDKVHVCGMTASTQGIALRVTFSIARAGKKLLWQQSKRLISGTLVALLSATEQSPATTIVAIVAARPLDLVQQNPPEIDLFIESSSLVIDPAVEYIMVEHRGSYFEAHRHTMLALQKMSTEPLPLEEHLVHGQRLVPPAANIIAQPMKDIRAVFHHDKEDTYANVNLMKAWPTQGHNCSLDQSQQDALLRMLTKQLAIVQGPPGTGKTHVSLAAIKIFLANRCEADPPIIIACQTNHALDQFLRHVASFEEHFARLGGRSKDKDTIGPRTIRELRKLDFGPPPAGTLFGPAKRKMDITAKRLASILEPLQPSSSPLNPSLLTGLGIITETQAQSLENGASHWVQSRLTDPNEARNPFVLWLGKALLHVPEKQGPEKHAFEYEETDLEYEQLREQETEDAINEDDETDALYGTYYPIADNFTCCKILAASVVEDLLRKHKDLWKIHESERGSIYRYFQEQMKKQILDVVRREASDYDKQARERQIGRFERDEPILKQQKIIGMTTTGFSKYRALISALKPKIVLIEEAAETLEAPILATCLPTLEHLLLVGDHKQLRPHCQTKHLEDKPFYLNVSQFERLVNNKVEFSTLTKQRRMIPEIRRILHPIYKDLIQDHASVTDVTVRPKVPGMGSVSSFFYSHTWSEQRDDQMSVFNSREADMIIGQVQHLLYNGVPAGDITILTFYNGQRKHILKILHRNVQTRPYRFKVVTVDSYQGEENRMVILSLVRSNAIGSIGFLDVDNRVCVALSRAQCGFYIFGNSQLLDHHSKTWTKVIGIMRGDIFSSETPFVKPCRLDESFPVYCDDHDKTSYIKTPEDWDKINGGCERLCGEMLPCGHKCPIKCHPFGHELVNCQMPCARQLPCDHQCEGRCGEPCRCEKCARSRKALRSTNLSQEQLEGIACLSEHSRNSSNSWTSFAQSEPERWEKQATLPYQRHDSELQRGVDNSERGNVQRYEINLSGTAQSDVGTLTTAQYLAYQQPGKPAPYGGPSGVSRDTGKSESFADDETMRSGNGSQHGQRSTPEVDWSKEPSLLD
ncbi:P-loop containing nucleoside triphosphate hydrolase protein [Polychaeton citri CBS 116435]|uniref:P-loop containing nucleoside triphosphate hydrolase protein n=1 Tax=Polychaeton citri CBS 116435 TaxID=1314669 RepID=A0A9P4PYY0_9PEZI|nr:P-loop containing nucleoside triphosphate hydrolase protein [Polychaeton citri CBS 116435]